MAPRAPARLVRRSGQRWRSGGYPTLLLLLASIPLAPREAGAVSPDQARTSAGSSLTWVESQIGSLRQVAARARELDPARLVASGELYLRTKDYEQAIDRLNEVLELGRQGKVTAAVEADSAFLLAEAYFASGQLDSAGRYYELIADRVEQRAYEPFAGRAVSRLVDVALGTRRLSILESLLAKIERLSKADPTGSIQFAHAKVLLAKGDARGARAAAARIPTGSTYEHRALYLSGAALVKEAEGAEDPATHAAALETFRRLAALPAKTSEDKHIVDLAFMALGRLLYERGAYSDAAEAYAKVQRTSPEFTSALYELGWTYARLGDYERGQRAIEVFSALEPGLSEVADGALLRADMLLRSGKLEHALLAYQKARRQYEPLERRVAEFLESHADPADYYDVLTTDAPEVEGELPTLAIEWAREEAEEERLFVVADEVKRTRRLVKRSRSLIVRLESVLSSPSRSKMFPELHQELTRTVSLAGRVALVRHKLALGLDEVAGGGATGELAKIREERRGLMDRLGDVPAYPADFTQRQSQREREFNAVSQELQRLTLRTDYLQAMGNGLRRVLKDKGEKARSPEARTRFEEELRSAERELFSHRQRIERLREEVEMGRAQIGLGDPQFQEDAVIRRRFRELFAREVALTSAGRDRAGAAAEYARSLGPLLRRADAAEEALERAAASLAAAADAATQDVAAAVARERKLLEEHTARLAELDRGARTLLGELLMHNLTLVHRRLKNVVQRADVGITEQAWEVREAQIRRVRELKRERAREERVLNDELREILDDEVRR